MTTPPASPDKPVDASIAATAGNLGKLAGAAGVPSFALLVAFHLSIFQPAMAEQRAEFREQIVETRAGFRDLLADHSKRPHDGVSAGLADVRSNEARIELLNEEIDEVEKRIERRLDRIVEQLDQLLRQRKDSPR